MLGPPEESKRLEVLRRYAVLDTPPEPVFDRIAWLAAHHFQAPVSTVTFVDDARQWFKAVLGLELRQTTRDIAFCAYAIQSDEVTVIPDALADPRFADNPLVAEKPGIRFYAGAPIRTGDGFRLGAVTVIDFAPRPPPAEEDRRFLATLADMVVEELEIRLTAGELRNTDHQFRRALAHSPIILFTQDEELRYTWIANEPLPRERFIGHTDEEIWPPDSARDMSSLKRRVMEGGKVVRDEMRIGNRCYDTTLEPLWRDGRLVGLAGAAVDVTEMRAAKEAASRALAEAERAERARSRMFAATSHDLRQPMQSLVLMLGVLRERLSGTRHVRVVDTAIAAADAMRGLLDHLLELARIEAGLVGGKPTAMEIMPLVNRLTAEYETRARAKGLRFRVVGCEVTVPSSNAVHGRMLVIDDERMVLEALALTLKAWGIDVVAADSTSEALAALAGQPPPDAILADYRLRGETTGVEAIEAVRRFCNSYIPGVLITGDASPRRLAEAKASGHLLLHKPVAAEELRRVVASILPNAAE